MERISDRTTPEAPDLYRLLAEMRDERRVAEAYSRGELVCEASPNDATRFADLLEAVIAEATPLARV